MTTIPTARDFRAGPLHRAALAAHSGVSAPDCVVPATIETGRGYGRVTWTISAHARLRADERGVTAAEIRRILGFGREVEPGIWADAPRLGAHQTRWVELPRHPWSDIRIRVEGRTVVTVWSVDPVIRPLA